MQRDDDDPVTGRRMLTGSAYADDAALSIPAAAPIVAYLTSVREPILSHVGEPFDFDLVLDQLAARVQQVIQVHGCFRTVSRAGVFVCH